MGSQENLIMTKKRRNNGRNKKGLATSSACSAPCLASSSQRTRPSSGSLSGISLRPQASVISARAPCTTTTLSQRLTSRCTTPSSLPFTIASFACAPVRLVATVTLLHVSPALVRTGQSQAHQPQAQPRLHQLPLQLRHLLPPHQPQLRPSPKRWTCLKRVDSLQGLALSS